MSESEAYLVVKTTLPKDDREILKTHLDAALDEFDRSVEWAHRGDAPGDASLWDWHSETIALSEVEER